MIRSSRWAPSKLAFGRVGPCLVFALHCHLAGIACAQSNTEVTEGKDLVNYAFAHHLGTGLYAVSGQAAQVYSIPFSYTVRDLREHPWGLRLTFPLTVGFYDFKAVDIIDEGLPDNVETLTFSSGAEFFFQVTEIWRLVPFFDIGLATVASGAEQAYIYSVGARSYVELSYGRYHYTIGNRVLHAGYSQIDNDIKDSFGAFETGVDLRRDWHIKLFGRETDLGFYFVNYLYVEDLRFLRFRTEPVVISKQNEVGITFGARLPERFWGIELEDPRLGLGYRFGDGLEVTKLVFGAAF